VSNITTSVLHKQLTVNFGGKRRPKIAVIDTGYDPKSYFLKKYQHRMRLFPEFKYDHYRFHWKDFWKSENEPLDDDGHGTSMLSTIMNIAPFADICVARIAGTEDDLLREITITQKNVAKVLKSIGLTLSSEWLIPCAGYRVGSQMP
jgi:subtilisin family serine protease